MDISGNLRAAIEQRKLYSFSPYPWQKDFFDAGADHPERMLMAANGVGKTMPSGFETACHLTGEYPDWWEGKVFKHAPLGWVGSITNQTQRDYTQPVLIGGDLKELLGTGFIPRDRIVKVTSRQAGIPDVADTITVRHKSGGLSKAVMKTYEQGFRMWQGAAPDFIWGDEQPDETTANEKRIFAEAQTRVFRSSGIMYWSLTPLLGETDMITHFMAPKHPGIFMCGATWDDAPHLKEEDKERLRATYPAHELEARTKGVPMMGEGRVFSFSEEDIKVSDFEIPPHFARIKGIDFGVGQSDSGHPAATVDAAWDRDNDIFYITRTWKQRGAELEEHCQAIRGDTPWVPVSWPHDGNNTVRGKHGNEQLKDMYIREGVRMLGQSARYQNDTGGGQAIEPIIQQVETSARNGGFKVFASCKEWFEEARNYHRKEGKIVALKDDVLKASFYALMMKRYASSRAPMRRRVTVSQPLTSARL